MDNNESVGCRAGKTILIDPNKFQNQDFFNNVSVPLEDLSIFVQLETTKRARTILTDNGFKFSNNTEGVKVNFIEGSDFGGRKSLTTRYTDLTTSFDGYGDGQNNDNESLGITSIDIDFNSQHAPTVVINFIDLRGSSVFQNESMLKGSNKYSTLFQLPYPIFKLTIKGYYGLPVTYDLHMTKFNAKFNSKTGNFEITANFIGYTYAMLSDMLIGYLRAIQYTEIGKNKYETIRQTKPYLLTLDELIFAVSNIDKKLEKLAATDETIILYNTYNTQIEKLSSIKNSLNKLGIDMDVLNNLKSYEFIRPKSLTSDEFNKIVNSYNQEIKEQIENFNKGSDIIFGLEEFSFSNADFYQNLNITILQDSTKVEELRKNQLKAADDFEELLSSLTTYAINNQITNDFNVYDFRLLYQKLTNKEQELKDKISSEKTSVGEKIRESIKESLVSQSGVGLDPTVRNIVEIFTTSVEVFLSVLFDVSDEAQNNAARKRELSKFEPSSELDYKKIETTTENSASGKLDQVYYAWPEYRIKDEKLGLKEEYLGNAKNINKYLIDELIFIDDLHKAFLTSSEVLDKAKINAEKNKSSWVAANPLDTPLFLPDYPYARFNPADKDTLVNVLLTRAMIYMGLSNYALTPDEIKNYANAETNLLLLDADESLKNVIYNLNKNDILASAAKLNNVQTPILKNNSNQNYSYNYMFNGENKTLSLAPLNKPVNTNQSKNFEFNLESTINSTTGYSADGGVFFTNYTTSSAYKDTNYIIYSNRIYANANIANEKNIKVDDGGKYLRIIYKKDYDLSAPTSLQSGLVTSNNVMSLETLSKPLSDFRQLTLNGEVGYNQFGGVYGIQEYNTLNYNIQELESAPFRLLFFADGIKDNYLQGVFTLARQKDEKTNQYLTTEYDLTSTKILSIKDNDILAEENFTPKVLRSEIGQNRIFLNEYIKSKNFDYTYPYISFIVVENNITSDETYNIGLFGSRFYYEQKTEEAKAFLFLHSFPWNGLTDKLLYGGVFHKNEILNTFANRAGFISAPRMWIAFIGGLIWRMTSEVDPIVFHNGTESFIPTLDVDNEKDFPNKFQYLTYTDLSTDEGNSMSFTSDEGYKVIDELIVQLPDQVKKEFVDAFKQFVSNQDGNAPWQFLKPKLQIFDGTGEEWVQKWNDTLRVDNGNLILAETNVFSANDYDIRPSAIASMFNSALSNYNIVTTYNPFGVTKYNFFTELKDYSPAIFDLMFALSTETYIGNFTYRIWDNEILRNNGNLTNVQENIRVPASDMDIFLDQLIENLKPENQNEANKTNQRENELFGTDSDVLIKQLLYRTCKNIYDKWIAGTESDDKLIFRDGQESRNPIDFEIAKYRGEKLGYTDTNPTLIDSFRFVNRSFKDIGDDLFVNPKQIVDSMINNPNISFYDLVTSLLSANKFNFIALPNYINYKDEENIKTMFKPMEKSISTKNSGPSFVCVYIGQPSKHLNFKNSEYENDGIDFRCGSKNNLLPVLATDFTEDDSKTPYENDVAVFAVNYGQQNQNIFKDITLDQSEFTETAESLQIIDEIANKGSENKITLGGQNMYDVYSVRSYSTEIEMMGNAMIQPMMYFQLNNIPMFHGAYMITRVGHSIRPNHMSTTFKGVRIKNAETPLLDAADLYMPLLESIKIGENSTASVNPTVAQDEIPDRAVAGLFVDPFENDKKLVRVTSAPGLRSRDGKRETHKGVDYAIPVGTNLLSIYDGTIELIKYNLDSEGRGYGLYIVINHGVIGEKTYKSVYGHMSELDKNIFGLDTSNLTQDQINSILKGFNPNIKVKKGQIIGKSGGDKGKFFLDNVNKKYDTAGGSSGGHLHHELRIGDANQVNTSAFSLSYVNGIPYLPLNAYVKYKDGIKSPDAVTTTQGDNADYWSLVAICSLEAGTPQARADVAQSIYNRLATPGQAYGKTIKNIICAPNQYQPTFNNRPDWLVINDQNTAITAIKNAKNWTTEKAKNELNETILAINNETLKQNSRKFIESRTEFLAENPTSSEAIGVVQRTPTNENNAFFWRYAGKKLKGESTPLAINWENKESVNIYLT
jgi:murein DD-endopeptidase MepM/ murein hydrolase activator NlpD